jgi:hypothetical protein
MPDLMSLHADDLRASHARVRESGEHLAGTGVARWNRAERWLLRHARRCGRLCCWQQRQKD